MSIGKNIKSLRESKGLTQDELGKIIGVSGKTVSSWELETKTPRMGAMQNLADFFQVKKSDIIEDDTDNIDVFSYDNIMPIKKKKFPLLGEIACGKPIYADENWEGYIESGADIQADYCLRAKGDSMINARILDGDIVFIRKQPIVENGEIAAVVIDDEATLKRVYYYPKQGKLILNPENPAFEPLVYIGEELNEIEIIGKAVAFQSDVK